MVLWQKIKEKSGTWFYRLRANLPLVLGDRINLDHLLQVDFVGRPRAQSQSERGFP